MFENESEFTEQRNDKSKNLDDKKNSFIKYMKTTGLLSEDQKNKEN